MLGSHSTYHLAYHLCFGNATESSESAPTRPHWAAGTGSQANGGGGRLIAGSVVVLDCVDDAMHVPVVTALSEKNAVTAPMCGQVRDTGST